MAGASSLFGAGGGGFSSSSSATSGDAKSGDVGISIGGINTGQQSSVPSWVWIAALAMAAFVLLPKLRGR